jgi:hypothetical protein
VLHDDEDLADIRELCNNLSLDDELLEEAVLVQKHYMGKSSGRHLLRTVIEFKERHRQDFESNSAVTTPADTETESDSETASTPKAEKTPQKIPFLGSRRPVYWKILPVRPYATCAARLTDSVAVGNGAVPVSSH